MENYCYKCRSANSKEYTAARKARKKITPASAECDKCGETKSSNEFVKSNTRLSGISASCKVCSRARAKVLEQKRIDNFDTSAPVAKTKICSACKKSKPRGKFKANLARKDGVESKCKACFKKMYYDATEKIKLLSKISPAHKICSMCKEDKPCSAFSKNNSDYSGLTAECKKCRGINKAAYRNAQKEKFEKYGVVVKAKVCSMCNEKKPSNKFYVKKTEAGHLRRECKACSTKLGAKRRLRPDVRIIASLRERLRQALHGKTKSKRTLEYLGCSVEELRLHLEAQFVNGMSWDNYGMFGWHIDHIKPISKFDLSLESEIKKACHYTNLQPLWASDNRIKGDKYDEED